ncbi:hypothetical protein Q8791_29550 [Nocardiopsis sp. CT-R113]|uniref:Integral membrane protein n=1 Tax=Nocardiopsis codii TaxID=3065942 RepID=A0ABU7KHA2_9ACTN|nr:hypothetical protein [Nocardiopsis sp. CT-R113]MEE2041377.1 hypothetical protein [Nocardiopsis sp. CT-R113]
MIPQGDPHPSNPRPPSLLWFARLQIYRDNHPRAFTRRTLGFLFLLMSSTALTAFDTAGGPWRLGATLGLILLVLCAVLVAVSTMTSAPAGAAGRTDPVAGYTRFPPDADPAKLAESWRLVREGRLGPDPETNRLGRIVVEQELGNRSTAAALVLFLSVALLNTFQGVDRLLLDGVSPLVVVLLGLAAVMVGLAIATPFLAPRRRRRVEAFRDAYDKDAQEAPETPA